MSGLSDGLSVLAAAAAAAAVTGVVTIVYWLHYCPVQFNVREPSYNSIKSYHTEVSCDQHQQQQQPRSYISTVCHGMSAAAAAAAATTFKK